MPTSDEQYPVLGREVIIETITKFCYERRGAIMPSELADRIEEDLAKKDLYIMKSRYTTLTKEVN